MSRVLWLAAGFYRVVWRAITIPGVIWRVRWTRAIWGGNEAAFVISRLRKYAIIPALRTLGASVAESADIEPHLLLHNAHAGLGDLTIGAGCHVGKACSLDLAAPVTLEPGCTLSMHVALLTHTDMGRSPLRDGPYPVTRAPVTIGAGAYIGARATILQGVRVGRCAVVAAGSVVRGDVPDGAVVVGIPARVIKILDLTTDECHDTSH